MGEGGKPKVGYTIHKETYSSGVSSVEVFLEIQLCAIRYGFRKSSHVLYMIN